MLRWPGRETVERALRAWAAEQARRRPELLRLGFFGSYARGDWGVGSDLDLVAVVETAAEPFERRGRSWPTERLPVAAEMLVYTAAEWEALLAAGGRFARTLASEVVWVLAPDAPAASSP